MNLDNQVIFPENSLREKQNSVTSMSTSGRQSFRSLFVFGLHICLSIWLTACGNVELDSQTPPAANPPQISADTSKPVIYFGGISRYNPRIMFEEYQPIMDYLSAETDFQFELKLGKSYEDAVQFLCSGEVTIASLGGLTYLQTHDLCNAIPILRPLNKEGKPSYHSVIVVRKDSPIRTLTELRGHSFAFASVHSTSGNLMPRYVLAEAGVSLTELSRYQNLKHHDDVARAVIRGDFEAGALKDIIAYRYLDKGLRIIHISQPIPSVPLVVRPDCDPQLVEAVKQALLKIDPRKPGQSAQLALWNEEFRYGFTEASDSDYDVLRAIRQGTNIP